MEISKDGALRYFINRTFIREAYVDSKMTSQEAVPYISMVGSKVKLLQGYSTN